MHNKTQRRRTKARGGIVGYPSRSFSHRAGASKSSGSLAAFQKEITVKFLELLNMIKLYHWKTFSYATHKATDDLYAALGTNIDLFMETLFGKTQARTNLMSTRSLKLIDLASPEQLKKEIMYYKSYLVGLDNNKAMRSMSNSDLYNIRDTILGDLNKFMYLLTLK